MDEGFVRTNLNNYIKVKLTAEGEKIFEEHYNWLFKGIHNANELKERAAEQMHIDSEGFATFQIHEFMNIFGEFFNVMLKCFDFCFDSFITKVFYFF